MAAYFSENCVVIVPEVRVNYTENFKVYDAH